MGLADVNQYNYQRIHDDKLRESICVAATVQVTSFDPAKMTVNVQPLSKHLENGKYESQPPILKVPVALTHCGGFIFRPWIKEGDIGTVVYLDHDMDATVTGGKEAKPLTERNHATTDASLCGGAGGRELHGEGTAGRKYLHCHRGRQDLRCRHQGQGDREERRHHRRVHRHHD